MNVLNRNEEDVDVFFVPTNAKMNTEKLSLKKFTKMGISIKSVSFVGILSSCGDIEWGQNFVLLLAETKVILEE